MEKKYFKDGLENLIQIIDECDFISRSIGRQITDPPRGFSTLLFSQLGITLVSMRAIADLSEHELFLDYHSMSILARASMESTAMLFYIGDIDCEKEEWLCRKWVLDLHDFHKRIVILKLSEQSMDKGELETTKVFLTERLQRNKFFLNIEKKRQKRLLNGDDPYVNGRTVAIEAVGLPKDYYNLIYKLFSQNTHAMPMTFVPADEKGLFEPKSNYSYFRAGLALEAAVNIATLANKHMKYLFPIA